jgi:hypothetical protein
MMSSREPVRVRENEDRLARTSVECDHVTLAAPTVRPGHEEPGQQVAISVAVEVAHSHEVAADVPAREEDRRWHLRVLERPERRTGRAVVEEDPSPRHGPEAIPAAPGRGHGEIGEPVPVQVPRRGDVPAEHELPVRPRRRLEPVEQAPFPPRVHERLSEHACGIGQGAGGADREVPGSVAVHVAEARHLSSVVDRVGRRGQPIALRQRATLEHRHAPAPEGSRQGRGEVHGPVAVRIPEGDRRVEALDPRELAAVGSAPDEAAPAPAERAPGIVGDLVPVHVADPGGIGAHELAAGRPFIGPQDGSVLAGVDADAAVLP